METRGTLVMNVDAAAKARRSWGSPAVRQGEMPMATLWAPLIVGGEAAGVVSVQNLDRRRAGVRRGATSGSWSRSPRACRCTLETARLIEETRQRNAELALINDVQRGLAENLEMQAMYDLVGDRLARDLRRTDRSTSGSSTAAADQIRFPYSIERGVRLARRSHRDHGVPQASRWRRVSRSCVNEDMERRCVEAATRSRSPGEPSTVVRLRPAASMGNRATGVISLQNLDREHAFSEADVRLLTTLAGSLQRRARERATVRGDGSARRGARHRQQRRTGAWPNSSSSTR